MTLHLILFTCGYILRCTHSVLSPFSSSFVFFFFFFFFAFLPSWLSPSSMRATNQYIPTDNKHQGASQLCVMDFEEGVGWERRRDLIPRLGFCEWILSMFEWWIHFSAIFSNFLYAYLYFEIIFKSTRKSANCHNGRKMRWGLPCSSLSDGWNEDTTHAMRAN